MSTEETSDRNDRGTPEDEDEEETVPDPRHALATRIGPCSR
jgi:hypothetical protein